MDPRLFMARVYKALSGDAERTKQFESELNACSGPDDAIAICLRYM